MHKPDSLHAAVANSGWKAAVVLSSAAFLIYVSLGLVGHYALRSNAFDLSVFDYALWTTASGGPVGYVRYSGIRCLPSIGCPLC